MADETMKPNAPGGSGDPETSPETQAAPAPAADPAQVADRLAAEVDTLQGQIADLTDRLLRAHAEIENIRKRGEREREETAKYAVTKFARDVAAVADNFQRAIQAVPAGAAEKDSALKALIEGVEITEREFLTALERNGVKRIDPKGEAFNPHLHQAMMETHNAEVAPGTIVEVFQCGYVINDRVLRPAMVVVAKGGAKSGKPEEAGEGASGESAASDPPTSDNGPAT